MSEAGQRFIESTAQALEYATMNSCCCSLSKLGQCCRQPDQPAFAELTDMQGAFKDEMQPFGAIYRARYKS